MNKNRRSEWEPETLKDGWLNGALIAVGIVGLLVALLEGPPNESAAAPSPALVSAAAVAERAAL